MTSKKSLLSLFVGGLASAAFGQVPDLLNSLDAGGGAMATGGALYSTGSGSVASYYNPAAIAFADKAALTIATRNLPVSNTVAAGNFNSPSTATSGTPGKKQLSHAGYVMPLESKQGPAGVLALTYTIGGFIEDYRTAPGNLTSSGLTYTNYRLHTKARADYYTVSYAKYLASSGISFGIGLSYLKQYVARQETYQVFSGSTQIADNSRDPELSDTASGYAVTLGIQGQPKSHGDYSWGLSYRTPTKLHGNPNTGAFYDTVPGRLMGGIAFRKDGIKGTKDFLVYGVDAQLYHGGSGNFGFDRTNQQIASLGLEYNTERFGGRVPIRVGYQTVKNGGDGFANRNALTYGLGYRPENNSYAVDLSFASPQNGGFDVGLALTYRFK